MRDKDQISADGAVELEEDALGEAQGGYFKNVDGLSVEINPDDQHCSGSKWKMASFDGKGNDVMTEEITIVSEHIKRK